jgi:glutaredoxin-dependent peroxiredoxin
MTRMQLKTGQPAPDFTLYDSDKNKVTLSELRGNNVLLLFFPAAFTSVCTAELCSVRDNLKNYEQLDARVFGISVDTVFTLAKYKEEQKLNFPLLSDFNKNVSKAYGTLYETFILDMQGVSKRSAFLIDEEGIIQYAEVLENAGEQPDFQAIQEVLESVEK